jgi:hypothetical protein
MCVTRSDLAVHFESHAHHRMAGSANRAGAALRQVGHTGERSGGPSPALRIRDVEGGK